MRSGGPFREEMAIRGRQARMRCVFAAESCAMSDYLVIGGWSGRRKIPVDIIDETPEGFTVKALESAFIPGRGTLKAGQSAVVPKAIVKLEAS